jgi:hypothetical protein
MHKRTLLTTLDVVDVDLSDKSNMSKKLHVPMFVDCVDVDWKCRSCAAQAFLKHRCELYHEPVWGRGSISLPTHHALVGRLKLVIDPATLFKNRMQQSSEEFGQTCFEVHSARIGRESPDEGAIKI